MTMFEYAIARLVHKLEEEAKRRPLKPQEQKFLDRTRALMQRLADEERA